MENIILADEEIWNLIEERYSLKTDYTKRFIFDSIKKFGDIYDYDKTNRVDTNLTKVIVTCRIHGDFLVDPNYFTKSKHCHGCPKCNPSKTSKKDPEIFKSEVNLVFPQFTIPDGSIYVNNSTKMTFYCNIHDLYFEEKPGNLLSGKCGCKECYTERKIESRRKTDEQSLLNYLSKKAPNIDASNIKYIGQNSEVDLICKDCGHIFSYRPVYLRKKIDEGMCVCPECSRRNYLEIRKQTFIDSAIKVWRDQNDYSNIIYHDENLVENIKCNICGDIFTIRSTSNHLKGQYSCSCRKNSKGEDLTEKVLISLNINYQHCVDIDYIEGRKSGSGVEIDFIFKIDNREFWIECDGEQHYEWVDFFHETEEEFSRQLIRDVNVYLGCLELGKIFIKIPYTYYKFDLITDIIKYAISGGDTFEFITYPIVEYPECYNGRRIQYGKH